MPTFLQIVTKNTSTLDYSMPLLWKLRQQYPEAKIAVLFAVGDKRQIIRDAKFYSDFFTKQGIQVYDFGDFLKTKSSFIQKMWRQFFRVSYSDVVPFAFISEAKGFANKLKFIVQFFYLKFCHHTEKRLGKKMVELKVILPSLSPDLIFFDQRTFDGFYQTNTFAKYLRQDRTPIVVMPHAPHFIHPEDEFFPFYKDNLDLADLADFWVPFAPACPWQNWPERKNQFPVIGYPGLDAEWWAYLKSQQASKQKSKAQMQTRKCLLVIRKFLPQDFERPENYDPFTLDYNVMLSFLTMVRDAIQKSGLDIEVCVKPHPSNNRQTTTDLVQKVGFAKWSLSYEPFYEQLPQMDLTLALFSTAVMIPALHGIPTILFHNELQEFVNSSWDVLAKMYTGFEYYVSDLEGLTDSLKKIGDLLLRGSTTNPGDSQTLRQYYPDQALRVAMDRIAKLLQEQRNRKVA